MPENMHPFIKKPSQATPQDMLLSYPSVELDNYVLKNILDAPGDIIDELSFESSSLMPMAPQISRKFSSAYIMFILAGVKFGKFDISYNDENFEKAINAKQLTRKGHIKIWRVVGGQFSGYGRTLPEAMCKLLICEKNNIISG